MHSKLERVAIVVFVLQNPFVGHSNAACAILVSRNGSSTIDYVPTAAHQRSERNAMRQSCANAFEQTP